MIPYRRLLTNISIILLLMMQILVAHAQVGERGVRCQILRRQNPLPPSVGEIYSNFGRYFNVTIFNDRENDPVNVRLLLHLAGPGIPTSNPEYPISRDQIFVKSNDPVSFSFVIPPKQARMLSEYELTTHFSQYRSQDVVFQGMYEERFSGLTDIANVNPEYQLLPEGHYGIQLNVIENTRWEDLDWLCSDAAYFDIAYKAKAPEVFSISEQFLDVDQIDGTEVFTLTPDDLKGAFVRFRWLRPEFNEAYASLTGSRQFTYDFRMLELVPGQDVSKATTVQFEQLGIITNYYDVPIQEILSARQEDSGAGYVVQVRARSAYEDINNAYYSLIENQGYSNLVHIGFADSRTGGDNDDPDDIRIPDPPTNTDVKVTIAPKQTDLPMQLAPYFETPGALFNVTIDNTDGIERDVNLLLQYYKDNWGLMPRTKDQWTDIGHTIHLAAGEIRPLTTEEINLAAGGYTMDKVVEYYPLSGYVGKVTLQTEWLDAPNTVCCRVGKFEEGVSATRSTVLARGTAQFGLLTAGGTAEIKAEFNHTADKFSTDATDYFDNPEESFQVSLSNEGLLPQDVVIQFVLENLQSHARIYGFDPDCQKRYVDRISTTRLRLNAGEQAKILSADELHQRCGGFIGIYTSEDDCYYSAEGSSLEGNYAFYLEVYDPDKVTADPVYGYFTGKDGLLAQRVLSFGTAPMSVELEYKPGVTSAPVTSEGYFDRPGDYFRLRFFNNTGKDRVVLPVITLGGPKTDGKGTDTYLIQGKDDEIDTRAKNSLSGPNVLHPIKLQNGDSPYITGTELNNLLGHLKELERTISDEGVLSVEDCKLASGKHTIYIDVYDVEEYANNSLEHITDLSALASTTMEVNLSDLVVKITQRASQASTKVSSHYLMPADTYSISVTNRLDDTRVIFLQLKTTDATGKEWAVWGAYDNYDLAGQWVKAQGGKETVMTPEQINEMLGGYKEVMRADMTNDMTTVESILATDTDTKPSYLPEGKAQTILYAYEFYNPFDEKEQDYKHIGVNAIATDTVMLDLKDVYPIDVIVKTKEDCADNMPTETLPYFKSPGDIFEVSLVNHDVEDHTIGLNFIYNHKMKGRQLGSLLSDRKLTLPGRGNKVAADTVPLTAEQINTLVGNYTLDEVYEPNKEGLFIEKCSDPQIGSGSGHLQVVAFDHLFPTDTLGVDSTQFYLALHKVLINNFELNITNSERITDPKAKGYNGYKGEGFIEYRPIGFPIKLAVEFDSIWIDDNNIVTKGMVRSKKKEDRTNIIPYDLFEVKPADKKDSKEPDQDPGKASMDDSKAKIAEVLNDGKIGRYYNYVQDGLTYLSDVKNMITGQAVTLPLGIDHTHAIMNDCPVGIQMLSAAWTPDSSWVNLLGEYKMPETNAVSASNNILVLAAPFLRIEHDDNVLLPESGTLALLSDVTFTDVNTGFEFTCLSPKDIKTLDDLRSAHDGCLVSWSKSEFDSLLLDVSMGIPYLLRDDGNGNLIDKDGNKVTNSEDAARPQARLTAGIHRDGNWVGSVRMSAFQVPDIEGFTFSPTGEKTGILYDHSLNYTPKGVKFHDNYVFTHEKIQAAEHVWTQEKREKWQGLYWEELSVRFPDWLPAVTSDKNGKEETQNIVIAMNDMMYDLSGFTASFKSKELINLAMSGWGFTLDEMHLDVVQNDFSGFGFNGRITVPFMVDKEKKPGTINYEANMAFGNVNQGEDAGDVKLNFETHADTACFKVGFLPVVDMDFKGSYFNLNYTKYEHPEKHDNQKDDFKIKLVMNGSMGLASDESAGFNLPDIHFYNMYVANHLVEFTEKQKEVAGLRLWEGPTWHNGKKADGSDATLALSAGNWSLASMSKQLGPFEFTLDSFTPCDTEVEDDLIRTKLLVKGGVNIMDGIAGVTGGIKLPFSLNWKTKEADLGRPEFDELSVNCPIGGLKLSGSLKAIETKSDKESGYDGSIKITLPGDLIYINTKGGFHKRVRQADYKYLLEDGTEVNAEETYSACYLEAEVGSNVGIPLGVVRLTEIDGGFYINCMRDGDGNIVDKFGSYGGMFGLKMADASGTLINGGFKLLVFYDNHAEVTGTTTYETMLDGKKATYTKTKYSGRLSEIRLLGDIHAITKSATSDGLINATAMILYKYGEKSETDHELEHYFQISITLSGSGTAGYDFSEFQTQLNGLVANSGLDVNKIAGGATANIEETGALKDEDTSGAKGGTPSEKEMSADNDSHNTPPSAEVNIDFKLNFIKPEGVGNYPWYLRAGTPTARCKFTIIDFSFGNKTVGAGALLGANAYICLGNELPPMPPLPDKVRDFIYGSSSDSNSQIAQTGAKAAVSEEQRQSELGMMFDPSTSNGGLMMGAEVYGHFWCNALICYADVDFDAGFDIALLKLKDGYVCAETNKRPGKNDWYGQGQLYAYLKGEVGVMIKFLGKENRYPIVSLGLGGVLQAGMPNPTWFFGKFRAQGEIFGGLIRFNRSVEVKAGNVCTPLSSSPLDDIEIFADVTPGLEEADRDRAWNEKNAVSTFSSILYHTNMVIGEKLELMDENLLAQNVGESSNNGKIVLGSQKSYRTFKFLEDQKLLHCLKSPDADPDKDESWIFVDTQVNSVKQCEYQMNATTDFGILPQNARFRIRLIGHAEEYYDGDWHNPRFKSLATKQYETYDADDIAGASMELRTIEEGEDYKAIWRDTLDYYFCTGPTSKSLEDNILLAYPMNDGDLIFENEARRPVISLRQSIMSQYENATNGQHVVVRVSRPNHWRRDLLANQGSINVPAVNTKYLTPLYEYKVEEKTYNKTDAKYIIWHPVTSSYKELSDLDFESTVTKMDPTLASTYGTSSKMTSYEDRMPYVLQYILVTPTQQETERSHVETTEEHALELVGMTDQEYVQGKSRSTAKVLPSRSARAAGKTAAKEVALSVPGKGSAASSSPSTGGYGYDNAYNDFLNQGLSPADAEARAKELYEYTPSQGEIDLTAFAADFNSEIERELLKDVDETETNAIDEQQKRLADQSEQVLWSRVFYPVMDNNDQMVKNFAKAFVLMNSKPEVAFEQKFFGFKEYKNSWGGSDYMTETLTKPLSSYYVKFDGLAGPGNDIFSLSEPLSDNSLLFSYVTDDPWRILGLSQLGFSDGAIPRHRYITADRAFDNAQAMSVEIHTASANVWQRDNRYVGTMPGYTTEAQLINGSLAYTKMKDWHPAPTRPNVVPTLVDGQARDQMMLDDARYLWSVANLAPALARNWGTYHSSFTARAEVSDTYLVGNDSKASSWLNTYVSSKNVVTSLEASATTGTDRLKVTIPLDQIPLLYARVNATQGFYGSGITDKWWYSSSISDWTQRMYRDGKYHYFKDSHLLLNQHYSRWFLGKWNAAMQTVANTKNWGAHWLDSQKMNYSLYRPNIAIWDKKLNSTVLRVTYQDETNSAETNTYTYSIPAGYFWYEYGNFYYTGRSQEATYKKIYGRYE